MTFDNLKWILITETLNYIQDEDNILPRVGVITLGGITGLLVGTIRKGAGLSKLLYTTAGLGGNYIIFKSQNL